MAKYNIFGIRKDESMQDFEFKIQRTFSDNLTPEFEEKEAGNTLVYKVMRYAVNDDFRNAYGDFGEYIFVKDTVIDMIQNKLNVNIIGIIEEEEIPKKAGIMVKF
jgi:hypothetical protein